MLIKLSSKGQLVIPKPIRKSLGLKPGDQFQIKVVEDKIVLQQATSPLESLYGKFAGTNLLTDLEQEHAQEILND
jgi:AbrB family looped-hinge helix DNA binding protein